MKKLLVIIAVLFFSMNILSSCKKAYECYCGGQIVNQYSHKLSKSDASKDKAECEANEGCTFKRYKKH